MLFSKYALGFRVYTTARSQQLLLGGYCISRTLNKCTVSAGAKARVTLIAAPPLCLRLPSDPTSRWTPLPCSEVVPLVGRVRDLNPLESSAPAGRTSGRRRELPPPSSHTTGRTVPYPAVHEDRSDRFRVYQLTSSINEISPSLRKYEVGRAAFRCEAPAFHHGPRPLKALLRALSRSSPRVISRCQRVRGRFHFLHSIQRSFLRIHWSRSSNTVLVSATLK